MIKKHTLTRLWLPALAWLVSSTATGGPVTFSAKTLCVEGVATPLKVEVAATQAQRNRGLMQRDSLAEDAGMLFLFDGPMPDGVGFYMYRTLIPLDVAFAGPDGEIVSIMTMTPCPHENARRCKIYRPGRAFTSALEMNAGFFDGHGVEKGDRLFDPVEGRCDLAPDDEPMADKN